MTQIIRESKIIIIMYDTYYRTRMRLLLQSLIILIFVNLLSICVFFFDPRQWLLNIFKILFSQFIYYANTSQHFSLVFKRTTKKNFILIFIQFFWDGRRIFYYFKNFKRRMKWILSNNFLEFRWKICFMINVYFM